MELDITIFIKWYELQSNITSSYSVHAGPLILVFPVFLLTWKTEAQKIKISHLETHNHLAPNLRLETGYPFSIMEILCKPDLEDNRVGKQWEMSLEMEIQIRL